jgi:hypothetical protein
VGRYKCPSAISGRDGPREPRAAAEAEAEARICKGSNNKVPRIGEGPDQARCSIAAHPWLNMAEIWNGGDRRTREGASRAAGERKEEGGCKGMAAQSLTYWHPS